MTDYRRCRMLFVEDFAPERRLLEHRLHGSGIELTTATGVDDALDKLMEDDFDIVLTDLHMEGGSLGTDLLCQCHTSQVFTGPVIFLTAETNAERVQELIDLGAAAVLTKPADPAALQSMARYLLTGNGERPTNLPNPSHLLLSLPGCADELRAAAKAHNADTLLRVCRDLASSAGAYGLTTLARRAEQAVGAVITNGPTHANIRPVLDSIEAILSRGERRAA